MGKGRIPKPLGKLTQFIESLDLDKQVAATKWLEGVIVAQILTNEEREGIVKAANEYIGAVNEEKYLDAVNALIEQIGRLRKKANRALKKENSSRLAEAPIVSA
jgi:spore cortex formation protein SpoVR/YcgB (stage V sporulation)